MENATDALKMGAAILIFVVALSITIMSFSKARAASASVMKYAGEADAFYDNGDVFSEKLVGVDEVIANLYMYNSTQTTILFYTGKLNDNKLTDIKPVPIYYTSTLGDYLDNCVINYKSLDSSATNSDYNKRQICGFDINDELKRNEPWTKNVDSIKQFIDSFVTRNYSPWYNFTIPYSGSYQIIYNNNYNSSDHKIQISFLGYSFTGNFGSGGDSLINLTGKFVERMGEYNYDTTSKSKNGNDDQVDISSSLSKSTVDELEELIDNEKGQKKKVIQYIYVGNV